MSAALDFTIAHQMGNYAIQQDFIAATLAVAAIAIQANATLSISTRKTVSSISKEDKMRWISPFARFILGIVLVSVFAIMEISLNFSFWTSLLLILATFLAIEAILNCIFKHTNRKSK